MAGLLKENQDSILAADVTSVLMIVRTLSSTLTHCGLGNLNKILDEPITVIEGWDTCCEIALRRMSLDLTDGKSILLQVMAWCRQATSHYLSQCWPSFLSPYGVTSPNELTHLPLDKMAAISRTIFSPTHICVIRGRWLYWVCHFSVMELYTILQTHISLSSNISRDV